MTLHLIYLAERRQLVTALGVDRGQARGVALLREHHGRAEVLLHGQHGVESRGRCCW